MMTEPKQKYPDKVIEMALPVINQIFDGVTLETVKQFGYLPPEIISELEKQQAIFNLENEVYPISGATESKDGKTCDWCNSELIVKESTVSSSSGTMKRKVMTCPNGGMICKMNAKKNEFQDILDEANSKVNPDDEVIEMNTRNMPVGFAKMILRNNLEHGFKVSSPNSQMTKIDFGTTITFERKEKIVKKVGKIIQFNICVHQLDDKLKKIGTSNVYNLVKVETIGCLNKLSEHTTETRCFECAKISREIERQLVKKDLYFEPYENEQRFRLGLELQKDLVYHRVTVQRNDSELPRIILKALEHVRFNLKKEGYLLADEVLTYVSQDSEMIVHDTLKSKIVGQLKSLADKNMVEKKVIAHDFERSRYDKVHYKVADRPDQVDTFWKNDNYVGNASTLNMYRANDNEAIYLTKQTVELLNEFSTLIGVNGRKHTIKGIEREWGFDEAMLRREISRGIMQQFGYDEHMDWLYNSKENRLWIACKSKIKRRRRR